MAFNATTYYRRRWEGGDDKRPIFIWKNVGPISISDEGKLEFDCVQTVLQDVKAVYMSGLIINKIL